MIYICCVYYTYTHTSVCVFIISHLVEELVEN